MYSIKKLLSWAPLVARILVATPFLVSGYQKITNFAGAVGYAQFAGIPATEVAILAAIAVEVIAGLFVLFGYRILWSALVLAGYTVLVSFIFHGGTFFTDQIQQFFFMKNMGIVAALLYMARYGSGKASMEKK